MALEISSVWEKIENCEKACAEAMGGLAPGVPVVPARDVPVFAAGELPAKKGLSFLEGQARLLHDLASIELQAMELGIRTLREFQEAPLGFREELVGVTISESLHLKMCLQGLEKLGFSWGSWPVHIGLWEAISPQDALLDRILIVHRYLEGSGLDAGDTFLRKLHAISEGVLHTSIKTIVQDEIGHVEFGSRWYREVCRQEGLNPADDFPMRMEKIRFQVPKRVEKISRRLRRQAGFTEAEIDYLEQLRLSILKPRP